MCLCSNCYKFRPLAYLLAPSLSTSPNSVSARVLESVKKNITIVNCFIMQFILRVRQNSFYNS